MADLLASRAGQTHPHGKLDEQVSVALSAATSEALTALAFLQGVSRSEFMRQVLDEFCFGRVSMTRALFNRNGSASMMGKHVPGNGEGE